MVVVSLNNMENQGVEILVENYNNIIIAINEINISNGKLEKIKSYFKDEIGSIRRYENINTIIELMKVLEKRCIFSYDNVGKLYNVVNELEHKFQHRIGKLLILQSHLLSKSVPVSVNCVYYEDIKMYSNLQTFSLPDPVVNYISSKITRYWKKFARELQIIPENDIDKIDECNEDKKTRECLKIFIREVEDRRLSNPYEILLRALEIIGRRDIKEVVEGLLSINFKERGKIQNFTSLDI